MKPTPGKRNPPSKKPAAKDNTPADSGSGEERIAKRIARAGICSRREAERLIGDGRVIINGKAVTSPAFNVKPSDSILVDGKQLPKKEESGLWLYHKPPGYVCSDKDDQGRETIFDIMPRDLPRLMYVGRLDMNSEGLLLLTNDGELKRYLELPSTGLERTYRVRVFGDIDYKRLDNLKNGCVVDGVRYGPITVEIEKDDASAKNNWLIVTLTEGKNREVRNVMASLNLQVNRLIRSQYGEFKLGGLERGRLLKSPYDKVDKIMKQMKAEKKK